MGKGALAFKNAVNLLDVMWARCRNTRPRNLPLLMLFITYRCNLKCAMCGVRYNCSEQTVQNELSLDEYKVILRDAQRLNTTLMSISGGEALARGELPFQIITLGRELGIAAHLCSNGSLLNEEKARRLGQCGLRSASISLESPDPAIHDLLRGVGAHQEAVTAIRLLRQHAPQVKIGINYTITSRNYRNLAEMLAFSESLDVHQLKIAPVHTNLLHSQKPENDFEELFLTEQQLCELEDEMECFQEALRHSRLLSNHPDYLRQITASFRNPPPFRCYAGYAICTVDPVGRVSPCPDITEHFSVRKQSLYDIWRSNDFHDLRNRVNECEHHCWDPFYAEVSLRLGAASLMQSIPQLFHEFYHYFGTH